MRKDSKYYPLYLYLLQNKEDKVTLTFVEIEKIMRRTLPPTARTTREWWSNRNCKRKIVQSTAWMQAGYRMKVVDLASQQVTFTNPNIRLETQLKNGTLTWNGELIKGLRRHMNLSQNEMAKRLGVRQQKISEWETGIDKPRSSTCRLFSLVARNVGFHSEKKNGKGKIIS